MTSINDHPLFPTPTPHARAQNMGACISCPSQRVSGSGSSKNNSNKNQQAAVENEEKQQQRSASLRKVPPYGKRTNFGYPRDFESRYAKGKLLGHGKFGYTFVATDKNNGDRVAVKRIDKGKVILLVRSLAIGMSKLEFGIN